jgi:hypothetical protein
VEENRRSQKRRVSNRQHCPSKSHIDASTYCVQEKGSLLAMMKEEFQPNLSKEHADLKILVKTFQRFFRRYIPRQVKEKFKNSGRIDVYNNIITPFSFCCLIDTLQKIVAT